MTTGFRHRLTTLLAVLLLVAGSAISAGMMAPDRDDAQEARIAVMGFSLDDLCGGDAAHDHRCPFCHLVSGTGPAGPEARAMVILDSAAWHQAGHLHRAAQSRDHARSPRAPPSVI
ncbi:hypothetical protein ACRARG_04010 [Pseudooceanicola sp. C21-150M6]|uniref:hypothetical protein n=1 Tax=Pseudooceanicola sp. C21-150M6 TaxID=3434355 RepID=UPI003D7FFFB1